VIVADGGVCHFLAGDTTYTQRTLVEGQVDGVSPNEAVSLRTMQTIMRLAQEQPTVYLPSHDPDSANRLANCITVPATEVVEV
jgi:glyoxylase-like metal-dependent hydrolase (beta-lactamase superfamily II)